MKRGKTSWTGSELSMMEVEICNILILKMSIVRLLFSIVGLPDELIQKGKDIKSISEIEENGNNFKVTVTTGTKVLVNHFVIGQEAELETITGEKVKVSHCRLKKFDCCC